MIKHIIAQATLAVVIYASVAFALGGWWSPFDWEGGFGALFRGLLLIAWVQISVALAVITEGWLEV